MAQRGTGGRCSRLGRSTLIAELSYQCPLHCPYCSNPLDIGGERYRDELETEHWIRAFREARALGVLQLALTGGEPMLRRDLVELCAGARDAGLYSSLITAGTLFTRERARGAEGGRARPRADLDPEPGRRGERPHRRQPVVREEDRGRARCAKELDFPLTINCVLHRQNLDRIEELLELALELGAQRLELANTQYYGWAVAEPGGADADAGAARARRGGGPALPRARRPQGRRPLGAPRLLRGPAEAVHGRLGPRRRWWSRPNGDVLPCQAASTIPGLEFANVRDHPLEWIWSESDAFARFRGTDWMQEPCRTCPLGRQEVDFGGCRCQALRLTGDAAATDPVCRFSPHHDRVVAAREPAQTDEFVYRTMKRPRARSVRARARAARRARCGATRAPPRVAAPSMISNSSPLCPRSTARTQRQVDEEAPVDAQELAAGELLLELVDAADGGLQASLVGDEPDVVAVGLGEADLGPVQQDHALAAEAHDARRRAHPRARARSRSIGSPSSAPKTASVPMGWSARKTGRSVIRQRLAAEPGHDLRRADPVAVEHEPAWWRDGRARPRSRRRLPAHRGVERRHPRGDAEEEAGLLVGDDDLAAGVQGGERLSGPRARLGERRGQLGAAVAGALAQDRARAAHRLGQPPGRLRRKVGAPGRDVEHRDGIVGHRRRERPRRRRPTRRSPCTSARAR